MDFQSAMETFAEAWVAANTSNKLPPPQPPPINKESIIHHQLGKAGSGYDNPGLDYPKSHSSGGGGSSNIGGMDLSLAKRLSSFNKHSNNPPAPTVVGKSLPIHCVIEVSERRGEAGKGETTDGSEEGVKVVEVDDFVIISAGTPFEEVVGSVLSVLGYPKDQQAEGSILLRNWKPLRLDQVCDSPHKTVGDIFNDLTNHATLRVLVTRSKGGTTDDLKEKLLRLLLAQSSNILAGSGCPLDEGTLTQLVKGHWPHNLAEDVKRRFDQWYSSHQHKLPPGDHHSAVALLSGASNGVATPNHHHHQPSPQQILNVSTSLVVSTRHNVDKPNFDDDPHNHHHHHHPVFHGLGTQKTRMRTSFDPEMELPRLQQWFAENPHPSRHQIQQYVRELNSLECRKDRKPLDLNNVIYWFKNARAAQKRNELRYNGYSPSQTFHHHLGSQNPHPLALIGVDDGAPASPPHSNPGEYENSGSSYSKEYNTVEEAMEEEKEVKREEGGVVVKEETEEDFISVDVELTEGGGNVDLSKNNNPQDLSGKKDEGEETGGGRPRVGESSEGGGGEESTHSTSSSPSPHSSPSPSSHPYDFSGPPSMVSRFYPFFDHPFMAYRQFNSFAGFGGAFPSPPSALDSPQTNNNSVGAYETALNMMGRKPPGKPSPDAFHDFQNGNIPTMVACRGTSAANTGDHHISLGRMRGEDLFGGRGAASSAELISSIISRGDLGSLTSHPSSGNNPLDERRKRNRTFIDPVTEVPRLEAWFTLNTHPSHNLILKYTEELNRMPYRQKFPKLEPKNVQFWFKNRRAKCKRLKMTL